MSFCKADKIISEIKSYEYYLWEIEEIIQNPDLYKCLSQNALHY
ncbi:hypothetical protein SAMN06265219_108153 [Gracilimonas mengyeensis]|uniref:Uncharacterized protein n=1 Tax=Gracilimonas mengyeensis TaxID=1302730 RepID=A0A521DFS1_9BACT|nr:hypothetical protein SAMN06265219_108153 [Gracilimonas mengyeensis]